MSALQGYPVNPPPLQKPVVFEQYWAEVTFVHWPVDPVAIEHLYPPGTRPDVFDDGMTYVGLVPFTMRRTAFGVGPPIPYFGRFHETNVRLYSVDEAGRHGVLFRSLETARLAVVPLARTLLGIPYAWSRMRVAKSDDGAGYQVGYQSIRRWPQPGLRSRLTVVVGDVAEPTALEVWCTSRWGAHFRRAGRTWWMPNEHAAWPLRVADITDISDDLVGGAGVGVAGEPLRALFSPGVQARFGRPTSLRRPDGQPL